MKAAPGLLAGEQRIVRSNAKWPFSASSAALGAALLAGTTPAAAYTVSITAANPRILYLQVGVGSFTGGNYIAGGTPANNATVIWCR